MYVIILKQLIWKAILNCKENVTIFRNILLSNLRPPCYKINEYSLFFRSDLSAIFWFSVKSPAAVEYHF